MILRISKGTTMKRIYVEPPSEEEAKTRDWWRFWKLNISSSA
jgi:hypothetical protein